MIMTLCLVADYIISLHTSHCLQHCSTAALQTRLVHFSRPVCTRPGIPGDTWYLASRFKYLSDIKYEHVSKKNVHPLFKINDIQEQTRTISLKCSVYNLQLADRKSIFKFREKQYIEDRDGENDISKLGLVKYNM